ncbi:MAG: NAD(P)/FAD-dependent oxidoreductase, partial [Pseudomonadota bacterium]
LQPYFGQPLKPIGLRAGMRCIKGEMILSSRGIEGSAIYNLSPEIRRGQAVHLDLLPDLPTAQVVAKLSRPRGRNSLSNHMRKTLNLPPIKRALLREWAGALPQDPGDLAKVIKSLPMPVLQPFPLDQAISTAGGLPFHTLTDGLMLRDHPGVFCAGEMLDWDAPTGGYLITACLATGAWAGRHAAAYARSNAAR